MCIEFSTAGKKIIRSEEVGTVIIFLSNINIELLHVALVPGCESNLISLGQLRETGHHDEPTRMTSKIIY